MHEILKSPRRLCDLHGALGTVEELSGVVPIVHANAGCVFQHYLADKAGRSAAGSVFGSEIPSTEVIEKQIIFGGASRLREQIKNTVKVIDGELYIILGSCEAAMVGDDLAAMTREAVDSGFPAVFYFSAGFRGGSRWGHANVMQAIIRQFHELKKTPAGEAPAKIKGMVNVLGILPKDDIFYKGDLWEIKRILEAAGLEVNIFFRPRNCTAELERSARAEHTLVFSQWGIAAARELEELYHVPYTVFESLPLGIDGVGDFYQRLASLIEIDENASQAFLRRETEQYRYYLKSLTDTYYTEAPRKNIAIVGDTSTVARIGAFLNRSLGILIHTVVLTDTFSQDRNEDKPATTEKVALPGLGSEVFRTDDAGEIERIISGADVEMVLGSALEVPAARRLKIPHLTISYPNDRERVLLHKTYAGISGAYFLIEDYLAAVLQNTAELEAERQRTLDSFNTELWG
jgi:nitrogenase molybdenum-iron protein beta chain